MTLIPLASFLAGSLLSLLLPGCVFLAVVFWYLRFVRTVPETPDVREPVEAATPDGAVSQVEL
ncbi:MAG TPA: hypothetical protein VMD48_07295 [Solirubrobacteraceae bacterium]|nr:hypothetical protein [Solirubrobacteraceae bacterium]